MNIIPQDDTPRKHCTGPCGRMLPATSEFFHFQGKGKLRPNCKQCRVQKKESPQKGGRPRKVGDADRHQSPTCTKCGEADPSKFYYIKGKRKSICKKCDLENKAQQRKNKPEQYRARMQRFRAANPHYHRQWTYGLLPEEYQALLDTQFGLCAICGEAPKDGKLHVDHCHISGVVRGLLCAPCNQMLGMAKDNPQILKNAAKYLKLHTT